MKNILLGLVYFAELAVLDSQYNVFAIVIIEDRPVGFQFLIPDDYDLNMPPKFNGFPVDVSVYFMPSKIVDISLETMALRIAGEVGVVWSDQRITVLHNSSIAPFTKFTLQSHESERIWKPLLNFRNAMGSTLVLDSISYFNGNFNCGWRSTSTFHCRFNLASYPMDIQKCNMEIQALNYKSSVMLKKYVRLYEFTSKTDPKEYSIVDIHMGNCTSGDHFNAYYSCVKYGFTLQRRLGRHLIQTFVPSGFVVILSWVSFWLDPESSTAPRLTIGITTMLTLTRQFHSVQHDLPAVSYLKAVDVWMLFCMFMVFSTLLEFAIVLLRSKNSAHLTRTPLSNKIAEKYRPKLAWNLEFQYDTCATDNFSRRAFPSFFICFNLIFWCYYVL